MKSATRAMDVLELLSSRPAPLEATTIARICGVPRSSAYRLLGAMRDRGFVAVDDRGRWSVGPRPAEIAADGPSVGDAFAVLEAMRDADPSADARTLARATGLHVVGVERIVAALVAEGLAIDAGEGRYALGARALTLGLAPGRLQRLREEARPILADLSERSGQTANLLVADRDQAVYVEQERHGRAIRGAGWVGRRIPLAVSASGRALTGAAGAAVVRDAVEAGVTAVAGAVGDDRGPAAAVSVTGPSARLGASTVRTVSDLVVEASHELSRRLATCAGGR